MKGEKNRGKGFKGIFFFFFDVALGDVVMHSHYVTCSTSRSERLQIGEPTGSTGRLAELRIAVKGHKKKTSTFVEKIKTKKH